MKTVHVAGYGDLKMTPEGEGLIELSIPGADVDDVGKQTMLLYAYEAEALRDALIELCPLQALAKPAEPKPVYKVTYRRGHDFGMHGNFYCVDRGSMQLRFNEVAQFHDEEEAKAYADLMNSKA